jgi:glutathione S-transferase
VISHQSQRRGALASQSTTTLAGIRPQTTGSNRHIDRKALHAQALHRQQELFVLVHAPLGAAEAGGIPFEEVMVRFDSFDAGSAFKQAVAAQNPVGKVPVLVEDDGFAVWDTLAIAETLAEQFPEKQLWPRRTDPRRAPAPAASAPKCTVRDELLGLPIQGPRLGGGGRHARADDSAGLPAGGQGLSGVSAPQTREEYALARTERKTARGYRGFAIHARPT